jgi:hypothetical protein
MANIYLDNSSYVEFVAELAQEMTYLAYGLGTYKSKEDKDGNTIITAEFTEEAQDYYDSSYEYIELRLNKRLGVYSNTDLINKN